MLGSQTIALNSVWTIFGWILFTMDDLIIKMIGISHDMSHDLILCKETSCFKLNLNFIPFLSCSCFGGSTKRCSWHLELSQHWLSFFFPFLVDDIHTFHYSWLSLLAQHNIQFSTTIWIDFKISWSVFDFKVSLSWHFSQLNEK